MKTYLITTIIGCSLLVGCAGMEDYNTVKASEVGVSQQALPATVSAVSAVTQETSSTARNMGTVIGTGIGLGAGQLLGRGKGRIAAAAGMAAAGALAGRYLTDAMGRTKCQRVTVTVDATGEMFTFVQPIYKQIGALSVGVHGTYYHSAGNAHFVPDGMAM